MSEYNEYIVSLSGDWAHKPGEKLTEIVRCMDCKYFKEEPPDDAGFCTYWVDRAIYQDANGFCAWGERETINKTGDIVTHDSRATGGTLTAEQVMAVAGKHQPDYCSDTHVCFDWQAIADELNSRAERTCEMRADGAHCMNGVEFYECRSCGEYACIPTVMGKSEPPNYCPSCGAKVVK